MRLRYFKGIEIKGIQNIIKEQCNMKVIPILKNQASNNNSFKISNRLKNRLDSSKERIGELEYRCESTIYHILHSKAIAFCLWGKQV